MTRVQQEELDYPGDGLYYHNEKPFTGVVFYLSKNCWTQAEAEYKDGLESGWAREWHGPGMLATENHRAWGVREGLCREWDETGRLVTESSYECGVRVSGKRWDSDGTLLEDFHLQETDPAFQIVLAFRAARAKYGTTI